MLFWPLLLLGNFALSFFFHPFLVTVDGATRPFVTTWQTTAIGESITLPLSVAPAILEIDWGDGMTETLNASSPLPINHSYATTGMHNISLLGDMPEFGFKRTGDMLKIFDIVSWGDSLIMTNTSIDMFAYCTNLRVSALANDQPVFKPGAVLDYMFEATQINSPLNWSLRNVRSMTGMFHRANQLNQSLTFRNTSSVTKLGYLLYRAENFNQPVFFDDTSAVTEMYAMFAEARSFNQPLTFSSYINVGSMDSMFAGATSFNQPLDLGNVGTLYSMAQFLKDATSFNQAITLSNTIALQTYESMFEGAILFNRAVNFNTGRADNMARMFKGARSFNQPLSFNTAQVATMESMFEDAISFDQDISFQVNALTTAENMFKGAARFNHSVIFTNSDQLTTTAGMFANVLNCFNQPVSFSSTAALQSVSQMFLNVPGFQQSLAWMNVTQITNCSDVCQQCDRPIFTNCTPCPLLGSCPAPASVTCESPFLSTWRTTMPSEGITLPLNRIPSNMIVDWGDGFVDTVTALPVAHIYVAPSTYSVSIRGDVYGFAFNFQGDAAKLMEIRSWGNRFFVDNNSSYMFAGCTNLKLTANATTQPVFLTGATLQGMFALAYTFSSPLNWDLTNVVSLASMFVGASQMNQPLNFFNSDGVTSLASMFGSAISFNQSLVFSSTATVEDMSYMFQSARDFNQPVILDTRGVVTMEGMFQRARDFNQPVNFSTSNVVTMESMFQTAVSFNQPINFQADNLLFAQNMFEGATSFNQSVTMTNTNQLMDVSRMFAGVNSCFNGYVNLSTTASVTNVYQMFFGVSGFHQDLSLWSVQRVTNCTFICPQCGLPNFTNACGPCESAAPITSGEIKVCSPQIVCGSSAAPTSAPTSTGSAAPTPVNLCQFVQVSENLQVECAPPTPVISDHTQPGVVISPLFNITEADFDDNTSTYVFTLPIDIKQYEELGTITRACTGAELSCEWQNPNTLEFQQSGCTVSKAMVDMGSGVVGTQCTCTHLTVFAIVLRSDLRLAPLCHAQEIDYVLIALYSALALVLIVQLARLVFFKLSRTSLIQHALLLFASLLRVAYLVLKPVIEPLAALVAVGLLPSAIALNLFIYLLLAWASLQLTTLRTSPFAAFRKPFFVITLLMYALVVVLVVLLAINPDIQIVQGGSYAFAALTAIVCVLVLISGLGLRRSLGALSVGSSSSTAGNWRGLLRQRVLVASVGLSWCLLACAGLWVAAVQTDIIVSSAATLASTTCFYVFDWLSLCIMTWLYASGIKAAVKKIETRSTQS